MSKEYCKFKTAVLAAKKGFKPYISSEEMYWDVNGEYIHPNSWFPVHILPHIINAATQSELQKWIRDEKEIHIEIYCNASGWGWILTKLNGTGIKEIEDCIFSNTYEDALEEGLRYSLNRL